MQRHPFQFVLTAGMLIALLLAGGAAARTPKIPCPAGTFILDPDSVSSLTELLGTPVATLTIGEDGSSTLGACAGAARVRAKRTKTTVNAKWSSCGTATKIVLKAAQEYPGCSTLTGRIRAKGAKRRPFTATRFAVTTTLPGGSTTTTVPGGSTTTTTLQPPPPACGNGIVDGAEACEGVDGCGPEQLCSSECTCAPSVEPPATSQSLIAAALARGDIDRPTSLLYRTWALFGDSRLPEAYDGETWLGQDGTLFPEISGAWENLPPDIQAEIEPFLKRPTETGSYWDPGPPAGLAAQAAGDENDAVECPYQLGGPQPDWRATPTDHFVIWSCGFGDPNTDVDADRRTIAAALAEEVWAAMVPEAGPPKPDDFASGPAPQNRIDVYLVSPNLCKRRNGECAPIPLGPTGKPVLAAVGSARPCGAGPGGALTSSGFMLLDRERLTAPPASGPWPARYTFAHEFFHLIQNSNNLQAQGGGCEGSTATENVSSWLVEATAEWAAWAYFPNDGPADREELFRQFQRRPAAAVSLRSLAGLRPYEAFLYPFFVQQEKASRLEVVRLWTDSASVRTPSALDDKLDAILPLAEHFRDFAVRNFNTTAAELPGDPLPLSSRHQAQDPILPENVKPVVLEPTVTLEAPAQIARTAHMTPLTAQYEHYLVGDDTRWVRIDAAPLGNSSFVQLDVLANVAGTWERRSIPGPVFEFCRDDAGDGIGEFYLVMSHRERRDGVDATGTYDVRTKTACPTGWSGFIRYRTALDEHSVDSGPSGTEVEDDVSREEQVWTVTSTTPAGPPPASDYDQVELSWRGHYQQLRTWSYSNFGACLAQPVFSRTVAVGSGTGTDGMEMRPVDGGGYTTNPLITFPLNPILGTRTSNGQICTGQTYGSTEPLPTHLDNLAGAIIGTPELAILVPDPNHPNRFRGSYVIAHTEEPLPGGSETLDITVDWDLRRR